jgi:hypothetical protein
VRLAKYGRFIQTRYEMLKLRILCTTLSGVIIVVVQVGAVETYAAAAVERSGKRI